MQTTGVTSRTALLAGATGLIGGALLRRMPSAGACRRVTVLARGPAPKAAADPKLDWRQVDLDRLPQPFPAVEDVYIALGTTIKVAGSQDAFRHVDHDLVVDIARAAFAAGASRLAVVSALGADSTSRVFYNRVKGDMQAAIASIGYASVVFAQPSLLMGDRQALGQPVRTAEALAAGLLRPILRLVPRSVRPIDADDVAKAMIDALRDARPGVRILPSAQMHRDPSR